MSGTSTRSSLVVVILGGGSSGQKRIPENPNDHSLALRRRRRTSSRPLHPPHPPHLHSGNPIVVAEPVWQRTTPGTWQYNPDGPDPTIATERRWRGGSTTIPLSMPPPSASSAEAKVDEDEMVVEEEGEEEEMKPHPAPLQ